MNKLKYTLIALLISIATSSGAFDIGPKLTVEPILTLSYDLEDEVANSSASLEVTYQFTDTTDLFLYGSFDLQTGESKGIMAGVETTLNGNLSVRGYFTTDSSGTNDNLNVELQVRF